MKQSKLRLHLYPNEVLRKPTKKIVKFDSSLRTLAGEMSKLMISSSGIGIAAPQCGLSVKLIICLDISINKPFAFCNPIVIKEEGEQVGKESCLSFPNIWKDITRPEKITVRYNDLTGKVQTIKAEGLLARCLAHETDHLNGILFIDL